MPVQIRAVKTIYIYFREHLVEDLVEDTAKGDRRKEKTPTIRIDQPQTD